MYEVSKGKVMRQALGLLAQLQIAAANDSYTTVAALVERYGEGAEIHIAVFVPNFVESKRRRLHRHVKPP